MLYSSVHEAKRGSKSLGKAQSFWGRLYRAAAPGQKRHPQRGFKGFDLSTDSSVCDAEFLSGKRHAAAARGYLKGPQRIQ